MSEPLTAKPTPGPRSWATSVQLRGSRGSANATNGATSGGYRTAPPRRSANRRCGPVRLAHGALSSTGSPRPGSATMVAFSVTVTSAARRAGERGVPHPGGRQAEVVAQGAVPRSRCGRRRAPAGAGPPCRRTRPSPSGVMCGTRMKPSLASACTYSSIVAATVAGAADEVLPAGHLDDHLPQREPFGRAEFAPLPRRGDRVGVHPHRARPLAMVFSPTSGIERRQRSVRVVVAQVPVPQLLGELDRGLPADLLPAHVGGVSCGLLLGVAQHEGGGREHQQFVAAAAVGRPAGL